ncbi:hypothetical protein [Methylobacillus sp.]|uniref:hypothetical protein n=1 Tax=Methylobacillus sp. TaxID=56818 RepID=UPI0012C37435|nr:hypothetical protein [Methylobacillus sp.]MPS48522.1 hypothetical protein [Methylobacillus sp.]
MKNVRQFIIRVINWKKYPEGVFILAIPVIVLLWSLAFVLALLLASDGNNLYLWILGVVSVLAIYPAFKVYQHCNRMGVMNATMYRP